MAAVPGGVQPRVSYTLHRPLDQLSLDVSDLRYIAVKWSGVTNALRGHLHGTNAHIGGSTRR